VTGKALELQTTVARLAARHGIKPPVPRTLAPVPALGSGPIVVEGYVTVPAPDLERIVFRKHALGWHPRQLPPLYWRHDTSKIVGVVNSLDYDDVGLRASVTVADGRSAAALAPAFSFAASIADFAVVDADTPRYRAEVRAGWINEVSLTDNPANLAALVVERHQVSAYGQVFMLGARALQLVAKVLEGELARCSV
jgi:Caudovirus prohead serine protease